MSTPSKTGIYKNNNDDVLLLYSEYVRRLHHPKLRSLCRRQQQLARLQRAFGAELVQRVILQADLEYPPDNGIHNAFALVYAMCRDGLDDTLLRAREEAFRHRREQEEKKCRLRELQARGCLKCGWWDVDLSGYCYDCKRSADRREPTAFVKNAGISSEGGSCPPLTIFDSAAEARAASTTGRGLPPAFPRQP